MKNFFQIRSEQLNGGSIAGENEFPRMEREAAAVAQVSKPAVSPISKSARRELFKRTKMFYPRRYGNLRYGRLGSLRYGGWGLLAFCCVAVFFIFGGPSAFAQRQRPDPRSMLSSAPAGNYSSNLMVIREAQAQALEQAREMLKQVESERDQTSLRAAIQEMERSRSMLDDAENSPEKLSAAVAAQQNAYQALLKLTPREFRMQRGQNAGSGGGSGQPQRQQMEQLEMRQEENRYETERQARAEPNSQQREQLQIADRLKQLAQRQQDLNERLRELQTALQAAKTEQEREELQRQLKRLRDEQRQMLADVDQMRQQMEQSSNATPEAREQLDQTRSDMQRAAEEMERESPSGALAAGSRAQQSMEELREDLRRETSSQFTEQMRELRNQARDLARDQEKIARDLDALNQGQPTLDTSSQRKEIVEQMERQQSALTNLLTQMRSVTEQSETSEPLLSRQLYETLRRADQAQTEQLMEMGMQLADRGFLPQAGETERTVRQNINDLRESVERAAESVLGNESESLRYARGELADLTRQIEREMNNSATNAAELASAVPENSSSETNDLTGGEPAGEPGEGGNLQAQRSESGSGSQPSGNSSSQAQGQGTGEVASESSAQSQQAGNGQSGGSGVASGNSSAERLRQIVERLAADSGTGWGGGPITGSHFADWSDRMRDVERVLDDADLRNQLAAVRERVAALRGEFRENGRSPNPELLRDSIVKPMAQVRVWLEQELARRENPEGLVPLDRDPVPEMFSDLVQQYYEKLGSAK